ncbi:MAG: carboxypeptidase-like regulatory domain-containing protein [Bryobacteraceae bacterium]
MRDVAGAPVPFVEITLRGDHTDFSRSLAADSSGKFRFANLAPGPYTLVLISPVYGISVSTVMVEDGKSTDHEIVLNNPTPPGDEAAPRAYLDLIHDRAEIAPGQQGSTTEGAGPYAFRANMSFNANGQRGQNNRFLLDDVDNNDNWTGGALLNPPAEAIAGVSLLDGYIPAASGHATPRTRSSAIPFSIRAISSMAPASPRRRRISSAATWAVPSARAAGTSSPTWKACARARA